MDARQGNSRLLDALDEAENHIYHLEGVADLLGGCHRLR